MNNGFWYRRILVPWLYLKYGIENLFAYFPVIWCDRNWDWVYIAILLEFKLRRMADSIEKYGHHANAKQDVAKMRMCAALLKRIADEKYETPPAIKSTKQTPNFDYMMQQDERLLFETLRRNWRAWWD